MGVAGVDGFVEGDFCLACGGDFAGGDDDGGGLRGVDIGKQRRAEAEIEDFWDVVVQAFAADN